ncbi:MULTISPECIES: hypothetical protein [unclassified Streptomyces]|uniref:hypothetical protein n=1 Tax=unclassified Streptomyces TaxID=2593676 RepID=UPI0025B3462E|nr:MULTISPECIES: hypothetical protein [unclassified Streptomyces]MDN3250572.1 hypothetical protein [Streptomyces sp. ZSW22]MDN3257781.1 hypothetical protein [Streptomyces sp. MA25(2023)]
MTVCVICPGLRVPGRIHPRVEQIGFGLEAWAARNGLVTDADRRVRLRAAGFHRMAVRMLPDAAAGDVERLARWITVLFHLDDEQDEDLTGCSTRAVRDTYAALTAVLEGRIPPPQPMPAPVVGAVAALWPATAVGMSQHWRCRPMARR